MSELKTLQETQEPLSITQLSLRIKNTVEGHFSFVKIRGEVSGFKKHTSGHCYFALKDSDSVIDAVCWRGTPKTDLLKDGAEIIATGKVTTYPGRSKYQIVVQTIEPSGQGALLLLLQQLKEKLLKEGLFDEKHKKQLPLFPKKIGLITSPTGAVLRDILHRLTDRYPCNVLLWPVLVQGEGSALQVAKAIEGMNQLNSTDRPDILIVARGGGSFEDLFAFNNEQLIRAAFASKIPIISAIGHETDVTLLDFVADKRAPTPTGAAEIATPVLSQVFLRLEELQLRLKQIFLKLVDYKSILLKRFDHAFDDPKNIIREKAQYLDDWDERRILSMSRLFVQKRLILGKQTLRSPLNILTQQKERLFYTCDLLSKQIKSIVNEKQASLLLLSRTMEAISYKRTLDRGFAIVKSSKGKILESIEMVQKEPQISLTLKDGEVMVTPKKESKQGSLFKN